MANLEISQKTDKTRRKSLGMRLSTSAQFTGQIDRVRQNETLASVRHPQPPIYKMFWQNVMEVIVSVVNKYL